jgi:hypothetical protein
VKINNLKTCAKIKTQANYNHLQRNMIAPICPIPMHLHLNHEQYFVCHHILIMFLLFLSSTLHKAYKACKVEEKDILSTTYFSKTFNHISQRHLFPKHRNFVSKHLSYILICAFLVSSFAILLHHTSCITNENCFIYFL